MRRLLVVRSDRSGTEVEAGLRGLQALVDCPPPRRRSRNPKHARGLRREVYDRDEWKCVTCGAETELTLDHHIPRSRGGPNTYENLRTMCRRCNTRKGNSMPVDAVVASAA